MEWVETTGRTVAEALDGALDELGVDEADAEWEILEEPKRSLLGRRSEARVRARVRPVSREKPQDRRRRSRAGARRSSQSRGDDGRRRRPPDGTGGAGAPDGAVAGGSEARAADEAEPGPRRRRRRRPGGVEAVQPASRSGSEGEGVTVTETEIVPIEEQAGAAEEFTQGLVDAFGAAAEVRYRIEDDDVVLVEVTGENLGLLVGPRGATLQAIEELVRTVVQRRTGGHGVRIHVDVAGYRAKRRAALSEFTRGVAAQVLADGGPQVLEPMPASDRKVVHDVVAELDGVTTESQGEEPRRRVVIRPTEPATI